MDKQPPDKTVSPGGTAVPAAAGSVPAPDTNGEKSWGDKYKNKALGFIRNVGLNYIVNFAIAALGTYKFVNSNFYKTKLEKPLENYTIRLSEKTGLPKPLAQQTVNFFTKTQLLLCGGHILLPPLKSIHNHKNHLEFEIGHKLDVLQETLGRGNDATKRNIAEYKYIKDIRKAKPAELSGDDKALLLKHNIGDNFQFNEKTESWKHVLTARGLGVASTTALGFGLAGLSYYAGDERKKSGKKTLPRWMNVDENLLKKQGGEFGEKYLGGLKKFGIDKPAELGYLIVLELIYTFASKLGFDHMEHRMLKKEEMKEAAAAQEQLMRDKERMQQTENRKEDAPDASRTFSARVARPSGAEIGRKIIEEGGKDFRTREVSKPAEAGIALS